MANKTLLKQLRKAHTRKRIQNKQEQRLQLRSPQPTDEVHIENLQLLEDLEFLRYAYEDISMSKFEHSYR
jgi:hypothetical protein